MNDWKPIETAPKDRMILLGGGKWGSGEEADSAIVTGHWREKTGRWISTLCECDNYFLDAESPPTHWMQLPAPPGDRKGGTNGKT